MAVKWYTYFNTTKPNSPITVGGLIFLALTLFLLLLKFGVLWNLVKIQKSFDTALNQMSEFTKLKLPLKNFDIISFCMRTRTFKH